MKTAVLISGELRFLEECLPTMKFINDEVDVYVSTWDTTEIKNELLGIDIREDVTEERIRKVLPNATILIEPLECFQSKRYNDRMIHRWKAGWELIQQSGKQYSKILVTRSDMYFSREPPPISESECQFVMYDSNRRFLQDFAFSIPSKFALTFFNSLSVNEWQHSSNTDWHTWFFDFFKSLSILPVSELFPHVHIPFFRATSNHKLKEVNLHNVNTRALDWRDACAIEFLESVHSERSEKLNALKNSWGEKELRNILNTHKSGRLTRHSRPDADTLVIFSGVVRNHDASLLSLPMFGNVDVAVVTWDSKEARDFARTIRADQSHFLNEELTEYKECAADKNCQKMLYLWTQCRKHIDASRYKHVYITRPDVFVYAKDVLNASSISNGQPVSTLNRLEDAVGQDQLLLCTDIGLTHVANVASSILSMPKINNRHDCIHLLLYKAFKERGITCGNERMLSLIIDLVIQRDNYTPLMDDVRPIDQYFSILAASITWWRNTHKGIYGLNAVQVANILSK